MKLADDSVLFHMQDLVGHFLFICLGLSKLIRQMLSFILSFLTKLIHQFLAQILIFFRNLLSFDHMIVLEWIFGVWLCFIVWWLSLVLVFLTLKLTWCDYFFFRIAENTFYGWLSGLSRFCLAIASLRSITFGVLLLALGLRSAIQCFLFVVIGLDLIDVIVFIIQPISHVPYSPER